METSVVKLLLLAPVYAEPLIISEFAFTNKRPLREVSPTTMRRLFMETSVVKLLLLAPVKADPFIISEFAFTNKRPLREVSPAMFICELKDASLWTKR